jgi:hypothetical protein
MLLEKEPFAVKEELDGLRVEYEKIKACYETAYHALMKASLGHLCTECTQSRYCDSKGAQICGSFEWRGACAGK